MTLTDKEYQRMRDASIAILREIGVTTGGSNVQFAVDPKTGRMLVIEMNRACRAARRWRRRRRASRSRRSREAGDRLHARRAAQRHHARHAASFEPTIDYVVVKWPRFAFEKFRRRRRCSGRR